MRSIKLYLFRVGNGNCSFLTRTMYQYSAILCLFIYIGKLRVIKQMHIFLSTIKYELKDLFDLFNYRIVEQGVCYFNMEIEFQ